MYICLIMSGSHLLWLMVQSMSPHGSEREICLFPPIWCQTSKTFVISFIHIFTSILCMFSSKSTVLNLFNPRENYSVSNFLSQHGFEVQQLLGGMWWSLSAGVAEAAEVVVEVVSVEVCACSFIWFRLCIIINSYKFLTK